MSTWIESFRTISTVWIHGWLWNDAQCFKGLRKDAPLYFGAIHETSRLPYLKIDFDPIWPFPECNSSLNPRMAMKLCAVLEVYPLISRSHGPKNRRFLSQLGVSVFYCFLRSFIIFEGHMGLIMNDFIALDLITRPVAPLKSLWFASRAMLYYAYLVHVRINELCHGVINLKTRICIGYGNKRVFLLYGTNII